MACEEDVRNTHVFAQACSSWSGHTTVACDDDAIPSSFTVVSGGGTGGTWTARVFAFTYAAMYLVFQVMIDPRSAGNQTHR
jgi:hypothetical protein